MPDPLRAHLVRSGNVITRSTAEALGVTPSEIDSHLRHGRWVRLLPSVYHVGGSSSEPVALATALLRAAALWAPDGVLAGSAASWWQGWSTSPPAQIELVVPQSRRLRPPPQVTLRRVALDPQDVRMHRRLPVTTAERTALDLAARGCTDLLDLMLRDDWFDAERLSAALDRRSGHWGHKQAAQALKESSSRPFSAAERVLHRGLRQARITGWAANVRLRIGGQVVVPDVLFAGARLIVEVDGLEHHWSREHFERDRARQNLLVGAGYRVLRFTWWQLVNDLERVLSQIKAELTN